MKALNEIVNLEFIHSVEVGDDCVVPGFGPELWDCIYAHESAKNAAHGGCGAVVIIGHGNGLGDASAEIIQTEKDAPDGKTGVVDGMHRVHTPEAFTDGLVGVTEILDLRCEI